MVIFGGLEIKKKYNSMKLKYMNKELFDWLQPAYNHYLKVWDDNFDDENFKSENGEISMMHDADPYPIYVPYSDDEFIWQVKFDNEFAERWNVIVNKKELTTNERMDYWFKNNKPNRDVCDTVDELPPSEKEEYFNDVNIPKKLIKLTYNNSIEVYE